MPDDGRLDELRERLRATTEAAERLVGDGPPPQGWATPEEGSAAAAEAQALITLLQALRDVLPPELWDEARDLVRRLLLLVRAALDLLLDRLEPGAAPARPPAPPAQDIPLA